MSNVWISLARSALCVSRHTRAAPLLHLFTGYARSTASLPAARYTVSESSTGLRRFSRTSWCAAKGNITARTSPKSGKAVKQPRKPPSPYGSKPIASYDAVATDSEPVLDASLPPVSRTEPLVQEPEPLTWRDYDPVGGMPLPSGELSQPDINAVFDSEKVNVDIGNYILNVVHWRRMSGALIDVGLDFPKDSGVTSDQALKGLQYVRQALPDVDEYAAGQLWAEEETQRMQQELEERSVKLGIYKAEKEPVYEEEESDQGTEQGRERTGTSALRELRLENEAKWEQQQKDNLVQAARTEQTVLHLLRGPLELVGGVQPPAWDFQVTTAGGGALTVQDALKQAQLATREKSDWVKKYEERATLSKEEDAARTEDIGSLRRFAPTGIAALLTLVGCYVLSENYTPAPNSARLWPDTPPAQATITALTGVLVAAFVIGRLPPMWRFVNQYMLIQTRFPYAVGIVGAMFRHDNLAHLASNLAALWLIGPHLHEDVGRGTFLAIYLATGVCGGLGTFVFHALRRNWTVSIIGSSNCMLGVISALCAIHPFANWSLFGYEMPVATWFILAVFTAAEAFAGLRGFKTQIDHIGHLGGIFSGVTAGIYVKRKAEAMQMRRIQPTKEDAPENVQNGG